VGSSLKGAIRTALLDHVNNGRATNERRGLHEFQGGPNLFRYSQNKLDLQRDPMRLVQLSDGSLQGNGNSPTAEVFFAANLKRVPVADKGGQSRSTRADSGAPQILECIPYFRYRAFAAQLNIQLVDGINQPGSLPEGDLRFDVRRIASACNAFYRPILQQEIHSLTAAGYLDSAWRDGVTKILEDARLRDTSVFLLRVGRHSGAESVTLRGVRNIRIMKGKGQRDDFKASATTVWLAAHRRGQTTGFLPFGWILAEFHPLDRGAADEVAWLKNICMQSESALRARLQPQPRQQSPQRLGGIAGPAARQGAGRVADPKLPSQQPATPPREQAKFATTKEIWEKATITWQPGSRIVTANAPGNKSADARGKAAEEFLGSLSEALRKQLVDSGKKQLANVRAVVEITGNQRTLKRLA
jgi:CRISPR-associated protein Csm5